jgi:hypothetical protein
MIEQALRNISGWLAATPLSHMIQTVNWIIPGLQTVHILCVAVLFSSAVLVDLRILRLLQRDEPLPEVARRFLPAIWPVLGVLLITGSLLIVGEPQRSLLNSAFYLKMALLACGVALTAGLQFSLSTGSDVARPPRGRQLAMQGAAVVSLLVWCGVLFAGRWIAYTQVG